MNKRKLILLTAITLTLVFGLLADVPNVIGYQGRLTENDGTPLNENISITFTIYDYETGGTALWTETQNVEVSNGLFSVLLGESESLPTDIFSDSSRWIGINVDGDGEMTPRTKLTSVPYAIQAGNSGADEDWNINGNEIYHQTGNVGIGTTSPDEELSVIGNVRAAKDTNETEYAEIYHSGNNAFLHWAGDGNLYFRHENHSLAFLSQEGDFNISQGTSYKIGNKMILHENGEVNIFVGINNGLNITSGVYNTFLGHNCGTQNTEGKNNIFIGYVSILPRFIHSR